MLFEVLFEVFVESGPSLIEFQPGPIKTVEVCTGGRAQPLELFGSLSKTIEGGLAFRGQVIALIARHTRLSTENGSIDRACISFARALI